MDNLIEKDLAEVLKMTSLFNFELCNYSFPHIIYFWLRCVFVATHWLSLVVVGGGYSSLQSMG